MTPSLPSAFAANHESKPLPFDPTKLDGPSEKLIRSHWENNYGGSIKALNAVKQKLASFLEDGNIPPYVYNDLKREHLMRTGSVVLHEMYFGNLGGTAKPDEPLRSLIGTAFRSFETWEKEFKRMGAGLGGGSGWVTLGLNPHSGLLENYWQWDHLHTPCAALPVLVMDMYEHSYQMDYGAAAPAYVEAFCRNISWETVSTPGPGSESACALDRGGRPMKWVTRERPKIDRIACPWLITRYIDPDAEFLYVPPTKVFEIAKQSGAIPYDIPGAELSHDGDLCSFDALLEWCRHCQSETHNWPPLL